MIRPFKGLLLFAAAAAVGLASCSDESPWAGSDSEGGINLSFSADGRVIRQSRADDSVSPVVPTEDSFSIGLTNADGSYSKNWNGVEAFNREGSFPIGDFTLSASFGKLDDEGFNKPYFYGRTAVHVSPAAETDANIVATLANAMVSIRYTEQFKSSFSAYSAAVQTEGHDWVVFAQNEDRPAYIAPSDEVKLNITLTNFQGKQVTIQPAGFTAKARHHYVVNIGVDGSSGDLKLNVTFDDDVVAESVNVSLGDDLFNSPAPTVTAKGFTDGATIEGFEYLTQMPSAEMQVFAFGGLKEANLNIIADNTFSPAFGKSAQLVNASDLLQQQLASEGFVCTGFFKNVDKMGIVNFSEFLKKLPAGNYTIQLEAVDMMTRVSEPTTLNIKLSRVEMAFGTPMAINFGDNQITVDINTNCAQIKDKVTFKAPDSNNRMVDVSVKSATEIAAAGSYAHTIRYVLDVDPQYNSPVDVRATFAGNTIYTQIPLNTPDFSIQTDAFAKHVVVKISMPQTIAAAQSLVDRVRFFINGSEIPSSNLIFDTQNETVTITGLKPGMTYSTLTAKIGSVTKALPSFTTEQEASLTNGDFSKITETININPIQTGGKYTGTALTIPSYQINSSIVRSTPDGWANLNQLTCYEGSSNKNTWFLVPSTFAENGQTVIRSVGYNHAGTTPAVYNKTAVYYNGNAPTDAQLNKAAGELFLGSYSYNGSASRTDGIAWTNRPSTLSFDYKYTPYNNEQAEAYITLLGANGDVISTQTVYLAAASDMTRYTVALPAYAFGQKAARIKVGFKSTRSGVTPAINIPSGSALNDGVTNVGNFTRTQTVDANMYKAVAVGSVLVIDNVSLGYDAGVAAQAAKRQTVAKSSPKKKTNKRR